MARLTKRSVPTRMCGCPDSPERGSDCRFKPATETCPHIASPAARKLWSVQYVDLDTGDIVARPSPEDEIISPSDTVTETEAETEAS